jgi:hypothetical protein
MKRDDENLIAGLRELREITPPASLVPGVMNRIAQPAAQDLTAALRGLRETTPPPSLVPAVMRRIAEPAPVSFWAWLLKPRRLELRLSPLSVGAMALAGAAIITLFAVNGSRREATRYVVQVPAAMEGATVVVRFSLQAEGARKVAVAGDFNDWNPAGTELVRDGQGKFAATLRLPPGAHEYMFVVDGQWVTDPAASELRPDGFGRTNAVLRL